MKNGTYSKEQIRRATLLAEILFPNDWEDTEKVYLTGYGKKSNTGVLNTILSIVFDENFPAEV